MQACVVGYALTYVTTLKLQLWLTQKYIEISFSWTGHTNQRITLLSLLRKSLRV
jgi:hypothetical protein